MVRFGPIQYFGATGPGLVDSRTFTSPGVGTVFFATLPTNELWRVICFHYRLVTSATVAARRAYLRCDPVSGASIPNIQFAQYTQAASTTVDGWFVYNCPVAMTATVAYVSTLAGVTGLGEFWCQPGSDLHLNVEALQGGDQISVVEGQFQIFLL